MRSVKITVFTLLTTSLKGSAHALSLTKKVTPPYLPAAALDNLAKAMPQSSLVAPTRLLKYVVLGLGTQNYTCASESAVPGTTGAIATLYDIGSKLNDDVLGAECKIPVLSGLALLLSVHPEVLKMYLRLEGYNHIIGHHYFGNINGTSMPVFDFDQLSQSPHPVAKVSRLDGADAPRSAFPGLQQEGAVPWLDLADTNSLSLGGIDTVYRLETAGGKGPVSCKGRGPSFEVQYAAQYWVFGPKLSTDV